MSDQEMLCVSEPVKQKQREQHEQACDLSQQVATWYLIADRGKGRPQMPLKNMLKLCLTRTCFT